MKVLSSKEPVQLLEVPFLIPPQVNTLTSPKLRVVEVNVTRSTVAELVVVLVDRLVDALVSDEEALPTVRVWPFVVIVHSPDVHPGNGTVLDATVNDRSVAEFSRVMFIVPSKLNGN